MLDEFRKFFTYDEVCISKLARKCDVSCGKNYNVLKYRVGDNVGTIGNYGYYTTKFKSKTYLVHRIIWSLFNGEIPPNREIDHIDGNRTNNIIANLRLVSKENRRNKTMYKNNKSGTTGVVFLKIGNCDYCVAHWRDHLTGKSKSKYFSIANLGIMVAFRDAVVFRKNVIEAMNVEGAGYTNRHGN